jgi:hypothetical protein
MGNPGDVFRIKGTASEDHRHDDLEQKVALLDAKLQELRAEWDEFIEAVEAQNAGGEAV